MRVLVTGGAGFIGSHVVDDLVYKGHRVLVIDNLSTGKESNVPTGADLEVLDLLDPALDHVVKQFRPEVVSHFAAQPSVAVSMSDPLLDAQNNILAGLNVARVAQAIGCQRLIYITTGGALYGTPDYLPSDEDHPVRPESAYGLSKWTLERYLRMLTPAGFPLAVLRLANIFGPRQDPKGEAGVISIFTSRMLAREPVYIFGDGEQTRDFLYVGDVVDAHARALVTAQPVVVNISTGVPTSVNSVFAQLAQIIGYDRPPVYLPERAGELRQSVLANRRARETLGWVPRTTLRNGLIATVEWAQRSLVPSV